MIEQEQLAPEPQLPPLLPPPEDVDLTIWTCSSPRDIKSKPSPATSLGEDERHKLLARAAADMTRRIRAARRSPLALYDLLFTDELANPIVITWFHREWEQLILGHKRVQIEAPRGCCKCRASGQRIAMADGTHIPVEMLVGRGLVDILAFNDSTGRIVPAKACVESNGHKRIFEIHTSSGRLHRLTENEPLWTPDGWKRADQIKKGTFIGEARRLPEPSNIIPLPKHHAYFLGLAVGDVSCSSKTKVVLSCADMTMLKHTESVLSDLSWRLHKLPGDNVDYSISGHGPTYGKPLNYLRECGLQGHTCHTKRVPVQVFQASNSDVAEFLGAYWDCDGCCPESGTNTYFASVNRPLLEDAQSLLLRFGIHSSINDGRVLYKGKYRPSYRLHLYGENARLFFTKIPVHSCKGDLAKKRTLKHFDKQASHTNSTCIPLHLVHNIIAPFGLDFFRQRAGIRVGNYPMITMEKALRIAQALYTYATLPEQERLRSRSRGRYLSAQEVKMRADKLMAVINTDVVWVKVASTKECAPEQTWALCSPDRHTFICENGIAHNTSFMLAAVLWIVGRNPNIRIKWLGENDKHATKRLSTLHEILDDPDSIYYKVFPHIAKCKRTGKRPNNATMLNIERDLKTPEPTVEATGVLTAGTGGRADLIVMDDVVGESNAILNPALKPKVLGKLQGDWLNTLVPGGRVWCIFTPWADDDANAWFKRNAKWAYKRYAHGKPGDPFYSIFPEKFPEKELRYRRLYNGELHYARAYLCLAHTKDTVAVLPKHLRPITAEILTLDKLINGEVIISMDPSSGKELHKGKLDPQSIVIFLYLDYTRGFQPTKYQMEPPLPHFEIFILDAFQLYLPKREQFKLLWSLTDEYKAGTIVIEADACQDHHEWLIEDQARWPALQTVRIVPRSTKNRSKGQRLFNTTPLLNPPPLSAGAEVVPITYFHPKTILPSPQEEYIDTPSGVATEIKRSLREEILSYPSTFGDHILDGFTQGMGYIHEELAPRPDSVTSRQGGGIQVSYVRL